MRRKKSSTSRFNNNTTDIGDLNGVELAQVPSGPGNRLKFAREAKGISIDEMSKNLRITKDVIAQIEKDDYSHGISFTFIKGYLRSYARLVDLPADEVISAFEDLGLVDVRPETAVVFEGKTNFFNQDQALRWLSYGVLLGLVLLAMYWWLSQEINTEGTVIRQISEAEATEVREPEATQNLSSLLPQGQTQGSPVKVQLSDLSMKFTDECWVEVDDKFGKQMYIGLKSKGESLELSGEGPFKILLGNPKAVTLSLNKKALDIKKHYAKSSSRFVVG